MWRLLERMLISFYYFWNIPTRSVYVRFSVAKMFFNFRLVEKGNTNKFCKCPLSRMLENKKVLSGTIVVCIVLNICIGNLGKYYSIRQSCFNKICIIWRPWKKGLCTFQKNSKQNLRTSFIKSPPLTIYCWRLLQFSI